MFYFTLNEWVYKILWKQGQKHVFLIKDEEVLDNYEQIWDVIKNKLGTKFHSELVYDETHKSQSKRVWR